MFRFKRSFLALALLSASLGSLPSLLQPAPAQAKPQVKVSIQDKGKGQSKQVVATGVINVPIHKVWKALTDYGAYSRYMPRVSSSQLQTRNGNNAVCTMKLDLPFPLQGTWYTNRYLESPQNHTIRWEMIKGSIKDNQGSWQLKKQGNATFGTYTVRTHLGSLPIPNWMIDTASKQTVPSIFEAVENYARKL